MKTLEDILDEEGGRQAIEVVKVADTYLPSTNNVPIGTVILLMCRRRDIVLGLQYVKGTCNVHRFVSDQPVWEKIKKD